MHISSGKEQEMGTHESRRGFLTKGTVAAALGAITARFATAQEAATPQPKTDAEPLVSAEGIDAPIPKEFTEFSRWYPSLGGDPDSDTYLGKLVPGLRPPGLPPVPFAAPDLPKCPYKIVDGFKEFHIYVEHVRREFLPGKWIDCVGYNGTMPGPTIEATIGDRIRIVLHNHLPEPTTMHLHGMEDDVEDDGVPGVTQDFLPPGESYVYEFEVHQTGTFFYHSHVPLQEANGAVGFVILHPRVAWEPTVDRDFGLIFQNWEIPETSTVPNAYVQGGSWQTINGRSAPYTTPIVVKHGERVRIRVMNFSKRTPHSIHIHGYTPWVVGHEASRAPKTAWIPGNSFIIHIAQVKVFEFVANNPGDWVLHCHMVHHMLNFQGMTPQLGPRIRGEVDVSRYKQNLDDRPEVKFPHTDAAHSVPTYPMHMIHQEFTDSQMAKIDGRREVRGMRHNFHEGIHGLFSVVRVLPEDLYDLVMNSDEPVAPGEVFRAITEGKKQARRGA